MKKVFFFCAVVLSCTTVHAWNPPDGTLGLTSDTRNVTISTTPSAPTQIMTRDSNVQRSWVIFPSSFTVHFSSTSATASTTTAFGFGGNLSSGADIQWSPDGVNSPWNGPLWAVAEGQTPPRVSIFRSK